MKRLLMFLTVVSVMLACTDKKKSEKKVEEAIQKIDSIEADVKKDIKKLDETTKEIEENLKEIDNI